MQTTIDSMTGIMIKSPFFDTASSLELFPIHPKVRANPCAPQKNRVALLYGANGSGKSTIAQGFREYASSIVPRTVELCPMAESALIKITAGMQTEKFFVFDEEYVSRNIKVQGGGLGTIVLFGEQIELEKRLEELAEQITSVEADIDTQNELIRQFDASGSITSPEYWRNQAIKKLQAAGGWAETSGIRIKKNQIKARVTDAEVNRLGSLTPRSDEETTRTEFDSLFKIFDGIDAAATQVTPKVQPVEIPQEIIEKASGILTRTPRKPTLTLREQELLQMFGIEVLSNAKGFLSVKSNEICPTCLQPISEEHREDSLQQIENILNREVENYRAELKMFLLTELSVEVYRDYAVLDNDLLGKVILCIATVNGLIDEHNAYVQRKIADPLSRVDYSVSGDIMTAYKELNYALTELEKKRETFNEVVANRRATERELLALTDEIAHFSIQPEYTSMQLQQAGKRAATEKLGLLTQSRNELVREQNDLDAQRKNLQIAVEEINRSLSYIFYSDNRLRLYLEANQTYHLKVNGKEVSPDKISCGERNALALSYFFAEIAKETELKKLYYDEMCLIIDDPVSSFDVENRVGILSFLRYKLSQVLSSCATTKVLLMTHDVSVMFDLQKAMDEIGPSCSSVGKHAEYCSFHLLNKALTPFKSNSYNEYTRLMRCVYEYGCSPDVAAELTIGNVTRRVLEAFSTFTFKEGVEKVSLNPHVLGMIPDQNKRTYFQNSMYRLVLNTESHSREAMQGAPEASFFSHLTTAEKQRTARDVLCFMYAVNPIHVLSHLPDAQTAVEQWMENVK